MTASALRERLDRAAARLAAAGIEEARLDAELLLADLLGVSRTMLRITDLALTPELDAEYQARLTRRETREPLPYIVGWQEFCGLRLEVNQQVLIPRWDSEPLCEALAETLADRGPVRIADLGTGSGALAAAMARLLPEAEVWAIDDDPEALAVASRNFAALGLAGRIHVSHGDLGDGFPDDWFDGVICNPPYIETAVIETLEPEVRDHEPRHALDGGEDGLAVLRRVVPECARLLALDSFAAIECGDDQAQAVLDLVWQQASVVPSREPVIHDLGGRDRGVLLYGLP